jgi:23S rRNA (guanosine2251-2'-O)-methyltransferase
MLSIVIMLLVLCYTVIMNNFPIRLILNDLRGSGNVGSIMRTGDACGIELIYACGYTPFPQLPNDDRPPHVIASNTKAIAKTALGAEKTLPVLHCPDAFEAVTKAKQDGFTIIVLEQAEGSLNLLSFMPTGLPIALILGNEVTGVQPELIDVADIVLEIPMLGLKESLGVAVATGIALYNLRSKVPS